MNDPIELLYKTNIDIVTYLEEMNQISFRSDAEERLRKILLLSCGSYFESRITNSILDLYRRKANRSEAVVSFIWKHALDRKYFQLFKWDQESPRPNTNYFWALFGEEEKKSALQVLKDRELDESASDFIIIGQLRNNLIHRNLFETPLSLSSSEIYEKYKSAKRFVEFVEERLSSY